MWIRKTPEVSPSDIDLWCVHIYVGRVSMKKTWELLDTWDCWWSLDDFLGVTLFRHILKLFGTKGRLGPVCWIWEQDPKRADLIMCFANLPIMYKTRKERIPRSKSNGWWLAYSFNIFPSLSSKKISHKKSSIIIQLTQFWLHSSDFHI